MKKRLIVVLCSLLSVLMFSTPVMANTTSVQATSNSIVITKDTIVTKANAKDVLKYLGIDPSNAVISDKPITKTVTVEELKAGFESEIQSIEATKKAVAKAMAAEASSSNPADVSPEANVTPQAVSTTGIKTAIRDVDYGSFTARYSATGSYYFEPTQPIGTAWWTAALDGNVQQVTHPVYGPAWTEYEIVNPYVTNTLLSGGTVLSKLDLYASYTVDIYLVLAYGLIRYYEGSFSVSGHNYFDNTYIFQ